MSNRKFWISCYIIIIPGLSLFCDEEILKEIKEPNALLGPSVSIYEIIVKPAEYSGSVVGVVGVLEVGGADRLSMLYASTESFERRIISNGIVLFFDKDWEFPFKRNSINGRFVTVLGVVETNSEILNKIMHPYQSMLAKGKILRVQDIQLWPEGGEAKR